MVTSKPQNKEQKEQPSAAAMLENILGCKWSLQTLSLIRHGINRPGAMARQLDGLTTKVQSSCLKKMVGFGLLSRMAYPEVPPRVEYELTEIGLQFVVILDSVEQLQQNIALQSHPDALRNV